eukprot:TRINITY_DN11298_c0_g1_i1.p3 TRINITY_DN11298_c0_g1~~TRINITY_DN11298_c0_g1_i1.p3  ORF type:complete len:131 (+),score=4.70 TRINITY_DN11298_c0_g1_i1:216-608(+)
MRLARRCRTAVRDTAALTVPWRHSAGNNKQQRAGYVTCDSEQGAPLGKRWVQWGVGAGRAARCRYAHRRARTPCIRRAGVKGALAHHLAMGRVVWVPNTRTDVAVRVLRECEPKVGQDRRSGPCVQAAEG